MALSSYTEAFAESMQEGQLDSIFKRRITGTAKKQQHSQADQLL